MTRSSRPVAAGLVVVAGLAAGCGTASRGQATGPAAPPLPPLSLATTVTTSDGTWAVVVAGGVAARHDNFWQLLVRPGTSGRWRLVTPPGVASNGGLVAAPSGPAALTAAFRPSQGLAFTPLATSADLGHRWTAGVLDSGLARAPAAFAADPATGHMLALLASGTVQQSSDRGATWTRLTTQRAISRTGPGRACGLHSLPGTAWQPLPALPARTQALATGPGTAIQAIAPAGSVIAIWSATSLGGPWTAAQNIAVPIQYGSSG